MTIRLVASGPELLLEAAGGPLTWAGHPAVQVMVAEDTWSLLWLGADAGEDPKLRLRLDTACQRLLDACDAGRVRTVRCAIGEESRARVRRYVTEDFAVTTAALAMLTRHPVLTRLADVYDRSIAVWSPERLLDELAELSEQSAAPTRPTRPTRPAGGTPGSHPADPSFQRLLRLLTGPSAENRPNEDLVRGLLRHRRRDLEGARSAYEQAVASGHPDVVPRARRNLALVLESLGDLDAAESQYRAVINSGHAEESVRATMNLGWLLEHRGRPGAAEALYREAMRTGHGILTANAEINLARLLHRQGDHETAERLLSGVIDRLHPSARGRALRYLGQVLEAQGRLEQARQAYARVMGTGDRKQALKATRRLQALQPVGGRLGKPEDAGLLPLPPANAAERALAMHRQGRLDAAGLRRRLMRATLFGIRRAGPARGRHASGAPAPELGLVRQPPAPASAQPFVVPLFTRTELAELLVVAESPDPEPAAAVIRVRLAAVLRRWRSARDTVVVIDPGTELEFTVAPAGGSSE